MRELLLPFLVGLLAIALGAAVVVWLRRRLHPGLAGGDLEHLLAAHGAARCIEAARVLRRLAERGDSAAIAAAWEAIEMPLLQAIPDCPPRFKVELISALDACARACRAVETARRLMTMRNSMIA